MRSNEGMNYFYFHELTLLYSCFRPTVTEEELTESFTQHGEVKAFKFFQ